MRLPNGRIRKLRRRGEQRGQGEQRGHSALLMNDVNGDGTIDADALAAGEKVEHYYYAGWRVIEETDAASTPHTLAQTVFGTQYIDEPVCRDRNTDYLFASGSPDSDCLDSGGSQRYFYHQDANFRVVMLTDESGAAVERYDYVGEKGMSPINGA